MSKFVLDLCRGVTMENIWYLVAAICGYLFGSIPFALVIGKVFYKKDIRNYGSGNLGGTNAGRVLGKTAGLTVTFLDVLKGFIAMLIFWLLKSDTNVILLAGFATSIGHAFPLFANFKGGKSVSTYFGFLLGVCTFIIGSPWLFLIGFGIWIVTLYLTKYVSLSSMVATNAASLLSIFFVNKNYFITIALLIVSLFIVYRHRANIERIRNKIESKVTWI